MPGRFEAEKKNRIAALAKLLAGEPDGKALAAFAEILFERVAGEDLVEYEPAALAAHGRDAFAFFRHRAGADRRPGGRRSPSPIAAGARTR